MWSHNRGQVKGPPFCFVTPSELYFGHLDISEEQYVIRYFSIENTGGGIVSGNVSGGSPSFSIYSGGGDFELASDEIHYVEVKFQPSFPGEHTVLISTGNSCGDVRCYGSGSW